MDHKKYINKMFRNAFIIIITGIIFFISEVHARGIPGIDPSTMSVDPDPNYQSPFEGSGAADEKSPDENKTEGAAPPEETYTAPPDNVDPVITGLSVSRVENDPFSVKLRWDHNARNEFPIYIARSNKPFTGRQSVLDAENITSPPLSSKESSYTDLNIPNGTYYYAVLAKNEISSRGNPVLKRGVNISFEPIVILREDDTKGPPVQYEDKINRFRVLGLAAEELQDKVVLKWLPPDAKNIQYNVYRSFTPLDTKERIQNAQRLGIVSEGKEIFEDSTPEKNRKVFYGVTVTDLSSNREVADLVFRQSYIEYASKAADYQKFLAGFPGAIFAVASKEGINVFWSDPESNFDLLTLYRHTSPINNEEKLTASQKLGDIEKGVKRYEDKTPDDGIYYYAIFPKKGDEYSIEFLQDKTFTSSPVAFHREAEETVPPVAEETPEKPEEAVPEKPEEETPEKPVAEETPAAPELLYFRMITSQDSVKLLWEVSKYDQGAKFLIFRSKKFMQTYRDVQKNGQLLEELPSYIKEYVDESIPEGIYYYALVVERDGRVQEELVAGKNYVLEPAIISGKTEEVAGDNQVKEEAPEVEPNEVPEEKEELSMNDEMLLHQKKLNELNRILSRTFIKNKFQQAVQELKPFTGDYKIPEGIRARAMFYSGLSYYNMRKYKQALFYFSNSEVRSFYPMRSGFWIKRSVEKIRK